MHRVHRRLRLAQKCMDEVERSEERNLPQWHFRQISGEPAARMLLRKEFPSLVLIKGQLPEQNSEASHADIVRGPSGGLDGNSVGHRAVLALPRSAAASMGDTPLSPAPWLVSTVGRKYLLGKVGFLSGRKCSQRISQNSFSFG